jgi:hypothetical protein
MNVQDAVRKIKLLETVSEARGFTRVEAECARNISGRIASRVSIPETLATVIRSNRRIRSWVYWEQMAKEFDLPLRHFGNRASFEIVPGRHIVTIHADEASWTAQRRSRGGWETIVRNSGPATLRKYMAENLTRGYSMLATPREATDVR